MIDFYHRWTPRNRSRFDVNDEWDWRCPEQMVLEWYPLLMHVVHVGLVFEKKENRKFDFLRFFLSRQDECTLTKINFVLVNIWQNKMKQEYWNILDRHHQSKYSIETRHIFIFMLFNSCKSFQRKRDAYLSCKTEGKEFSTCQSSSSRHYHESFLFVFYFQIKIGIKKNEEQVQCFWSDLIRLFPHWWLFIDYWEREICTLKKE